MIALGIVFFIFFLVLVPVLMIWRCRKDKKEDNKPKVQEEDELKLQNTEV